VRTLAEAEAERARIAAAGEAEAMVLRADADARRYEVDAAGRQAVNAAANVLSPEQIAMQVRIELLKVLPDIIRESVKPMERIEGIRIVQVDGLHPPGGGGEPREGGSLADQVVTGALRYRSQAPLIDSLLAEIGLSGQSIAGLTGAAHDRNTGNGKES
jgi:uncharacterized membrane protein YqiK